MVDFKGKLLGRHLLLPAGIFASALAILLVIGNPQRVATTIASIPPATLLPLLALSLVYEGIRFMQWRYLLQKANISVHFRSLLFSFAGGETARALPAAIYIQNYLLAATEGVSFAYSSAATTFILIAEIAICLLGLFIFGLGSASWLRWFCLVLIVAIGGSARFFIARLGTLKVPNPAQGSLWVTALWKRVATLRQEFLLAGEHLTRRRIVATGVMFTVSYSVAGAGILYTILLALRQTESHFGTVLAVYLFSVLAGLLVPVPTDLGIVEIAGVAALGAVGVEPSIAVTSMLIYRAVTLACPFVIGATVALLLRGELSHVARLRTGQLTMPSKTGEQRLPNEHEP